MLLEALETMRRYGELYFTTIKVRAKEKKENAKIHDDTGSDFDNLSILDGESQYEDEVENWSEENQRKHREFGNALGTIRTYLAMCEIFQPVLADPLQNLRYLRVCKLRTLLEKNLLFTSADVRMLK